MRWMSEVKDKEMILSWCWEEQQPRNMLPRECGEWYKMSKKKQTFHGYEDIWTIGISEKGRTISFGQGMNWPIVQISVC